MEHGTVFLDVLTTTDRLRRLDAEKVDSLAASMDAIELQQPVSIWASEDGAIVELVAGAHRVAAAQKLGWEKIDCIFVDMDDLDRQLWEIDENLIRSDLTDMQRAQHTTKRAKVMAEKVVLAKMAQTKSDPSKNADKGQGKFIKATAKATGRSEKSVKRDKARGEKIAPDVQEEIAGTKIEDMGVQLDALAAATPDEQRAAVREVSLGHATDVREVLPGGEERTRENTYKKLCEWWQKADKETRNKFVAAWITGAE